MKYAVIGLLFIASASAQLLVSSNDNTEIMVNGEHVVVSDAPADTVTIIDMSAKPPKVVGEVSAPSSWSGPPQNVAVAPDESIALIGNSQKRDPSNPAAMIPDNIVTVIDLRARPPVVLQTIEVGRGPNGISFNRAGTLALVMNRPENTISVLSIQGKSVSVAGKVALSNPNCNPSIPAFSPDGRTAYVTCTDIHRIAILSVNGTDVRDTGRTVMANIRPLGIDVTPDGKFAVVANIGNGPTGGVDTVSVIDLDPNAPRLLGSIDVGVSPEGFALSPSGKFIAVSLINASFFPKTSPYYHDYGVLKILRLDGSKLSPVTEIHAGHWCQGVAWSSDERTVAIECMVEKEIELFQFDGHKLKQMAPIKVSGGPDGLRTAH
jgi:DNA-binding beta-propeller fold protein YncE